LFFGEFGFVSRTCGAGLGEARRRRRRDPSHLLSRSERALAGPAHTVAVLCTRAGAGKLGASAIADALFGDYNPGGKLPYTIYPASFAAESDFLDMSMSAGVGRCAQSHDSL
jgi:hypothetical protein